MPQIGSYSRLRLGALFSPAALMLVLGCGGAATRIQPPTGLTYPQTSVDGIAGQPMVAQVPTVGGRVRSYTISPALPPGLSFDAATGAIEGIPAKPFPETTFTVTASNEAGFDWVNLRLSVAGRLPDLRFQWAGAFETFAYGHVAETLGSGIGMVISYSGILHWAPLLISSPTQDGWTCTGVGVAFPLVGGTRSSYTAGYMAGLDQQLDDFASHGMIITSLDLSVQGFGVVATGPLGDATEYSSSRGTMADLNALAAQGTQLGQQGAVITAVATRGKTYDNAPSSGKVLALWSYRRSDPGTYEVQVISGTPLELSQRLPILGQQGYVITAFGAGDQQTYIAVGTRPTGVTTPHSIQVAGTDLPSAPSLESGFLPIGGMRDPSTQKQYWVYQR